MFKIEHNTETNHVFSFPVPESVAEVFDGSEGVELERGSFEIVPVYEPGEPVKLRLTITVRETEVRGDA
jgi:hypothetical protein